MKTSSLLRRLTALLLVLCMLCPLAGCSKYRVEMSNKAQSETMLSIGETKVPFEVVYFFYHTYLDAYPEEDFDSRMARVCDAVCELYAIFEISWQYDIDPYGGEIEEMMDEAVREMIDYFPTRRDYIDRITEQHMTDNVSRLLLRSYLCQELMLIEIEKELEDDDILLPFLEREDVIRVLSLSLDFGDQTAAMRRRAEEIVAALAAAEPTDEAFLEIARQKATTESAHTYITVGQWYSLCGEGAPAPTLGIITEPLYEGGTCLMMRVSEKDIAYAKENRDEICPSYLECAIQEKAKQLTGSLVKHDAYLALTAERFA